MLVLGSWAYHCGKRLLECVSRHLPILHQRASTLESSALSRAWYIMAQILPLLAACANRLHRAVCYFFCGKASWSTSPSRNFILRSQSGAQPSSGRA